MKAFFLCVRPKILKDMHFAANRHQKETQSHAAQCGVVGKNTVAEYEK